MSLDKWLVSEYNEVRVISSDFLKFQKRAHTKNQRLLFQIIREFFLKKSGVIFSKTKTWNIGKLTAFFLFSVAKLTIFLKKAFFIFLIASIYQGRFFIENHYN